MNFFKSVFTDEPDPPSSDPESEFRSPRNDSPDPTPSAVAGGWNFGDLIKTIATKSETVIETYRRDLQEFGSGLKIEIQVAQGSLETVSTKIDQLGSTVTAQLISLAAADHDSDSSSSSAAATNNNKPYSRYESQLRSIQADVSTYVDDVADDLAEEYDRWKVTFDLEDKKEEMAELMEGVVGSVYRRVVPGGEVEDDVTFWSRYYFRVYKLKQAEDVRASLVRRAIAVEEDDEDLSWDAGDDEYEAEDESAKKEGDDIVLKNNDERETSGVKEENVGVTESRADDEVVNEEEKESGEEVLEKKVDVVEYAGALSVESVEEKREVPSESSDDKAVVEVKSKEAPAASEGFVRQSGESEEQEEEDLGWDEIEDLSSIDEKKEKAGTSGGGVANRAELQKRLSTAEEDEDLSWDIDDDDDDQPAKA